MKEYLIYGTKKGEPDWKEDILFSTRDKIKFDRVKNKVRELANANGFDRIRETAIDLNGSIDFTASINI